MRPVVLPLASRSVVALAATTLCLGCGAPQSAREGERAVTIYVSTDRVFSEPVLREYEHRSGIRVDAAYDTEETKSTGLANRLIAEQMRPQADVFWSTSRSARSC